MRRQQNNKKLEREISRLQALLTTSKAKIDNASENQRRTFMLLAACFAWVCYKTFLSTGYQGVHAPRVQDMNDVQRKPVQIITSGIAGKIALTLLIYMLIRARGDYSSLFSFILGGSSRPAKSKTRSSAASLLDLSHKPRGPYNARTGSVPPGGSGTASSILHGHITSGRFSQQRGTDSSSMVLSTRASAGGGSASILNGYMSGGLSQHSSIDSNPMLFSTKAFGKQPPASDPKMHHRRRGKGAADTHWHEADLNTGLISDLNARLSTDRNVGLCMDSAVDVRGTELGGAAGGAGQDFDRDVLDLAARALSRTTARSSPEGGGMLVCTRGGSVRSARAEDVGVKRGLSTGLSTGLRRSSDTGPKSGLITGRKTGLSTGLSDKAIERSGVAEEDDDVEELGTLVGSRDVGAKDILSQKGHALELLRQYSDVYVRPVGRDVDCADWGKSPLEGGGSPWDGGRGVRGGGLVVSSGACEGEREVVDLAGRALARKGVRRRVKVLGSVVEVTRADERI